jgi:hypothetical protein
MATFICTDASSPQEGGLLSAGPERDDATRDVLAARLDDRSQRYLVDMHPAFAAFRTVASQLAGLLVLAAAGANSGAPDRALLEAASLTYREASDKFRGLTAGARVQHVHHHLSEAARGIGATLAAVDRQVNARPGAAFDVTEALHLLRPAYRHLQFVSQLAPGFRLVETRDACCGFALNA